MTITKTVARRARAKVLGSLAVTHGYGILGLAIVQPMLSGPHVISAYQIAGCVIGATAQCFAVYIAPQGEAS